MQLSLKRLKKEPPRGQTIHSGTLDKEVYRSAVLTSLNEAKGKLSIDEIRQHASAAAEGVQARANKH